MTNSPVDILVASAKPAALTSGRTSRWLAIGAIVGPVLFTLAWIILGFLSPGFTIYGTRIAPYSPISTPISGLGLGVTGPYMNAAFVLSGIFLLIGLVGVFGAIRGIGAVTRWICAIMSALSALGIAMDGIFTLESFFPHFVGFALGCGAPVLSFLITGIALRRLPHWRRFGTWLVVASPLTLVLFVLALVTLNISAVAAGHGVAGLTERIVAVEVVGTFAALGWLAFRAK